MGRLFLRAAHFQSSGPTFARVLFAAVALCALSGCSDYGPPKNTEGLQNLQPVTGSVSFAGKPTPGAIVLFVPADEPDRNDRRVAGIVDDDGFFAMNTTVGLGSRPGVEPGDYKVVITWNKLVNPKDRDSDEGPDLLPEKYKDHKTSGLSAEILPGTNELDPFELKP